MKKIILSAFILPIALLINQPFPILMEFPPHVQAPATLRPSMIITGPSLTVPLQDPGIPHTARDIM